jgi:hypothetical protein
MFAATQVQVQVRSREISGRLRFPLSILVPPTAPHSFAVILVWYNRSVSGRRTKWTQSHLNLRNGGGGGGQKKKKKKKNIFVGILIFN